MKRISALFLVLLFCLSLYACSNKKAPPVNTPSPPVTNGSEKTKEPVTPQSLLGTYRSRLWFLDHTVTLTEDNAYTFGEERGTFSFDDKYITLGSDTDRKGFIVGNNCIYSFESGHFDADEDSGVTFTPDQNGFTDQSFEGHTADGTIPGCSYNYILLDLDTDGTFSIKLGNKEASSLEIAEVFEGTYLCKNATLLLTYNGQNYPLIMNNANYIFFFIYDKVS